MRFDETMINYAVYLGAKEFTGTADVTPPSISWMTGTLQGAGIGGEIEYPIIGHLSAMTLSMNFRTMTKNAVQLATPELKQIEVRGARQDEDTEAGTFKTVAVKHVYRIAPKSYSPGSFAPQANANGSGEYAVRYWAVYEDGEQIAEFDPGNYICKIGGVDYLAPVKSALGK